MRQCKPCITIKAIYELAKHHSSLAWKNFKQDVNSYSNINALACRITNAPQAPKINLFDNKTKSVIDYIRETAKERYEETGGLVFTEVPEQIQKVEEMKEHYKELSR